MREEPEAPNPRLEWQVPGLGQDQKWAVPIPLKVRMVFFKSSLESLKSSTHNPLLSQTSRFPVVGLAVHLKSLIISLFKGKKNQKQGVLHVWYACFSLIYQNALVFRQTQHGYVL